MATPPVKVQFSIEGLGEIKEAFSTLASTSEIASSQASEQLMHATSELQMLVRAMAVFKKLKPLMSRFIDAMKDFNKITPELGVIGRFLSGLTEALGPGLMELIQWIWLIIPVIYQIVKLLEIQAVQGLISQIQEFGPFALITIPISMILAALFVAWVHGKVPWGPSGASMLSRFVPKLPEREHVLPFPLGVGRGDLIHIDTCGQDNQQIRWFAGKLVTRLKTEGVVGKDAEIIYR